LSNSIFLNLGDRAVVVMEFYAAGHHGILRCGRDGILCCGSWWNSALWWWWDCALWLSTAERSSYVSNMQYCEFYDPRGVTQINDNQGNKACYRPQTI